MIGCKVRIIVLLGLVVTSPVAADSVRIGSKAFTESVILGEVAHLLLESEGVRAEHIREFGGTRVLWNALRQGEIDLYPEYTGTIREELLAGRSLAGPGAIADALAGDGIKISPPLGFNNSYALGVKRRMAERLGIASISDLTRHPQLRFGFSHEFMDRADGWPALSQAYGLRPRDVLAIEHALAYRALETGAIDVVDVYTTDPHIAMYDLRVLVDDRSHFPRYEAVFLYRADLVERSPQVAETLEKLAGRIDDLRMIELNGLVEMEGSTEAEVAARFLQESLGLVTTVDVPGLAQRLWKTTLEHVALVGVSLAAAIAVAVPLGVVASKRPWLGHGILGAAEIIQTIPGLALLLLIAVGLSALGLPSIGSWPVIVALFLYALLPIIRNTAAGLDGIAPQLRESAEALGLSAWQRLRIVELPLASPMILAGIKTTAVITVGYAALGGLIGAGGYGQPIMTGLRLSSQPLMMEGAVPAALLALAVKGLFSAIQWWLVPRGLRAGRREAQRR